jgi:hypothetical protein
MAAIYSLIALALILSIAWGGLLHGRRTAWKEITVAVAAGDQDGIHILVAQHHGFCQLERCHCSRTTHLYIDGLCPPCTELIMVFAPKAVRQRVAFHPCGAGRNEPGRAQVGNAVLRGPCCGRPSSIRIVVLSSLRARAAKQVC